MDRDLPSQRRFPVQAVMVLVPVVVLAAFAAWSLRWEKATRDVRLKASFNRLAETLNVEFLQQLGPWQEIQDPSHRWLPLPGGPNPDIVRFDSGEFEAVLGGSANSLTEAGLPLRPLAALQLLRREPDPTRLAELSAMLADPPSILTRPLLEEAEQRHHQLGLPLPPALRTWRPEIARWEQVQRLLTSLGREAQDGPFPRNITRLGITWWLERDDQRFRVHSQAELREIAAAVIADTAHLLPAGVSLRLGPGSAPLHAFELPGQVRCHFTVSDPAAFKGGSPARPWILGGLIALAVLSAVLGVVMAATSRRRAIELAERQGRFVAAVSHEMRTPLAAMRLLAGNLINDVVATPAGRDDHIRLIGRECERLSRLIDNVLAYTRWQKGPGKTNFQALEIRPLLETSAELIRPVASARGIHIDFELDPIPGQPRADPEALQRLLLNLLDNALKHSPEGTTILCRCGPAGRREWRLEVLDSGPGIPAAERRRVFEPFYRIGSELRRTTPGTGLGLALVKQTVDLHHGRIDIHDNEPQGTRFTITLPLNPGQ